MPIHVAPMAGAHPARAARRTLGAMRPYVPIAMLAPIIAVIGFWPTYYHPLVMGTVETPAIIQVHAAIFLCWLLIVIAQAALAANGQIALHIKVGNFGFAWGVVVVAIGWSAAFWSAAALAHAGDIAGAATKLFIGLTDMLPFALFVLAAWHYRRRPEIHKRLIIVATTSLLISAVHHMHWFLGRPAPVAAVLSIWLAPIYLGMTHDFITRRLVHPVYLLGIVAVIFMKFGRASLAQSDAWADIAAWFLAPSS